MIKMERERMDRPRDELSGELGRDCIEEFTSRRKTELGDVEQESTGGSKTFVDGETRGKKKRQEN